MSEFDGYLHTEGHGITYNHPGCKECMSLFIPLSTLKQVIEGMMFMYEHQIPGNNGEYLCENCMEVVKNGSPCKTSSYYSAYKALSDLLTAITNLSPERE